MRASRASWRARRSGRADAADDAARRAAPRRSADDRFPQRPARARGGHGPGQRPDRSGDPGDRHRRRARRVAAESQADRIASRVTVAARPRARPEALLRALRPPHRGLFPQLHDRSMGGIEEMRSSPRRQRGSICIRRTVDVFHIGEMQPERDHGFEATGGAPDVFFGRHKRNLPPGETCVSGWRGGRALRRCA